MHRIWSVLLPIVLAACVQNGVDPGTLDARQAGSGAPSSVAVGDTFSLRIGDGARVRGPDIRLSFDAVREDSRCPTGVQCVWAGNAKVSLTLRRDDTVLQTSLNTTQEPREAAFGGHRVQLVELRPYPRYGEPIPHSDYVARFLVTRLD